MRLVRHLKLQLQLQVIGSQAENPADYWDPNLSLCRTSTVKAPWLVIDYGGGTNMTVEQLLLYNSCYDSCYQERTMNVEIWVADEIPTSEAKNFSGVKLLGSFTGPGSSGEENVIQSQKGWEIKSGRYLMVLVSEENQGGLILNLRKVSDNGITCSEHVA